MRSLLITSLCVLACGPVLAAETSDCGSAVTPIHAIQGSGDSSPLAGQDVITEGVVTADFSGRERLRGYFLQAARPDDDPTTSEGLFVFGTLPTGTRAGDQLRLHGRIKEYQGLTELVNPRLLARCGTAVIAPAVLDRPAAIDESLEGMLVTFSRPLTIIDNYQLGRYGELLLASERHYAPTELSREPGDIRRLAASNQRDRIILDDGSRLQNPAEIASLAIPLSATHSPRLGDQVDDILAVVDSFKGDLKLQPLAPPRITPANPRQAPPAKPAASTRVVLMNVKNLFNGEGTSRRFPTQRGADNDTEYRRQLAKIVAAILESDADILALNELENDGFDEHSASMDLVKALAAAGRSFQVVSHTGRIGGDAITNALLFDPARVATVGELDVLLRGPFARNTRPSLLQHFAPVGEADRVFAVAVNHFKARSCRGAAGSERDQGEGCWNSLRMRSAALLLEWLSEQTDRDVLVVGDLNAYRKEAPLQALQRGGLVDLFGHSPGYSYSYFGEMGRLDHALATPALARCVSAHTWHSNADEPPVLDYNLEYQSEEQQARWYAPDPWRAADHDPLILDIDGSACE